MFRYLEPNEGRTVFTSYRKGLERQEIFAASHLEGKPTDAFDPSSCLPNTVDSSGWQLDLKSPAIGDDYLGGEIVLKDSMAFVFTRHLR